MKERPILFTPENAQKIYEGKKTQTRRIIKERAPYNYVEPRYDERGAVMLRMDKNGDYHEYVPYGVIGDRLWIKEAWRVFGGREYEYQQRSEDVRYRGNIADWIECGMAEWRPSIYMPRWACRTVVEITNIRVERVHDITQLDALNEGCTGPDHRGTFSKLWKSIHGQKSWDLNPWVWVIKLQKVKI